MHMYKQQSRESGHVLALVAGIVVIVTLMALSLLSLGLNSRTLAVRTTQKIQARCAAAAYRSRPAGIRPRYDPGPPGRCDPAAI